MIAVTSPGFVLFAALLAGLWYVCPPHGVGSFCREWR